MAERQASAVKDPQDWVTVAGPNDWQTVGPTSMPEANRAKLMANQQLPGSTLRLRQAVGAPEPPPPVPLFERLKQSVGNAASGAGEVIGGAAQGLVGSLAPPKTLGDVSALAGGLPGLMAKRMLVDPAMAEGGQAVDLAKQGRYSEAAGHGLAAAIPGIGPAAANVGEDVGQGEFGKAWGKTAAMVGMAGVAGAAPEMASMYRAAKTARQIKAPVEAWNHAVKPVDATATPKNLTIAGPYLKQVEQAMGKVATDAQMPTEGLSGLIDFTKSHIGQQTADAIAPHAGVQVSVRGYGNMALGQAETRLQTINALLNKYYKSDPEAQAQVLKVKDGVDGLKSEGDAIRTAEYDKLNQLGVTDAPRMKKVYGALRGLEDDIEKAHGRALTNTATGGGVGIFSEVASKVGKSAKGAAAWMGDNPLVAPPLEGIGKLYDWQRNFGSPEYILHRAWENYKPLPPAPFVTQGPLTGAMSRLLGSGAPERQTPPGAGGMGYGHEGQPIPMPGSENGPMPGNTGQPMLPHYDPLGGATGDAADAMAAQRLAQQGTQSGRGATAGVEPLGRPDVGVIGSQKKAPIDQRFFSAFEGLPDKDLRKGFGNLGITRARQMDEWLRQNNMTDHYPRLMDALDKWLTDLTPDTGVGRKGEMLH